MMRLIETTLALIGFSCTVIALFFLIGYATYCPPCGSVLAVFTENCK